MAKVKWQFKGLDVSFITEDNKLAKAILDLAKSNHLPLDTEIIIIYDERTTNSATADTASGNGDPAHDELSAVPVDTKKAKSKKASDQLSDLHGHVANVNPADSTVEHDTTDGDPNLYGDRLAL